MAAGHNPITLRLAVCLFEDVTSLDYQGPIALFGCIEPEFFNTYLQDLPLSAELKYLLEIEYLAHSLEPVKSSPGPAVVPSRRYDEVAASEQFDILMVPGGPTACPENVPKSLLEFVQRQAPGAMHILTICTGSWVLAGTGLLRGKKATTNKASFRKVVENTRGEGIEWIAKARWVVNEDDSRKIWTSSGVTAGMDMTSAFLDYLIGKELSTSLRGIIELTAKGESEDDFAVYYGLA
ncbi:Class I glutamine amidotransferase-like protein [Pleurotus pulmonarius]